MMSQIGNILPASLNPVKKNNYWVATCPQCNCKNTLFIYENSYTAFCNRKNNCGFTARIWDLPGANAAQDFKEKLINRSKLPKIKPKYESRSKSIYPALGKSDKDIVNYLENRIPGADLNKLYREKLCGFSRRLEGVKNLGHWLNKKGYKLLTPLYNIHSNKIVSAQARYSFTDSAPTILKDNGDPLKIMSLPKCPYGDGGATFGSLKRAMESAEASALKIGEIPSIIVAEGDIDYLTLRACGYDNSVGVPGVDQAKNVARYLQDIEWRGILILSMDGDNSGERSVKKVAKIIENDNIVVMNGRPFDSDINDAYNKWGGKAAIDKIIQYARPYKDQKRSFDAYQTDKDMVVLMRLQLWTKAHGMPTIARDRYRATIRGTGGKDSPLKSIARAVNCREVREMEIFYKDGHLPMQAGMKTRVAETPSCPHCVAVQWNLYIAKYLIKHWPTHLKYLTVPFKEGDINDALKKKEEICAITKIPTNLTGYKKLSFGKSLFVMIDVVKSHLVVITGAKDKNDIVLSTLRAIGEVKSGTRAEVLSKLVLPAHLSYAQYVADKGCDFEHVCVKDPVLTQKFKRYYSREELPWPSQVEIKEEVRRIRKEQAEKLKEELGLEDGYSVFVTFRERMGVFKKLIGISWKSISFDNITRSDMFNLPMNFDPKDPQGGNFLENPRLAPKPVKNLVDDFFWLHYGHPAFIDHHHQIPEFTPKQTISSKKDKSVEIKSMNDFEYKEMLMRWDRMGYNPQEHDFMPGTVSVSKLLEKEIPPL